MHSIVLCIIFHHFVLLFTEIYISVSIFNSPIQQDLVGHANLSPPLCISPTITLPVQSQVQPPCLRTAGQDRKVDFPAKLTSGGPGLVSIDGKRLLLS